jgi:hypothetical protein
LIHLVACRDGVVMTVNSNRLVSDLRTDAETDIKVPKLHRSPFELRARLVVECALDLLGQRADEVHGDIRLQISVAAFSSEFRRRYAVSHPELAFRTEATFERARLDRRRLPDLPRVILRQGPPPMSQRHGVQPSQE